MFRETIFALSSGALPAGVAVIRISGPDAAEAARRMAGEVPSPRSVALRSLRCSDGALLDRGLIVYFPGPESFTGEDVAELHLHGGKAVVEKALAELSRMPALRHAEPGEFTRRAFLNGKLDLVEAEALGELIRAETETQRKLAVAGGTGSLSALYEDWRRKILGLRAVVEAELDFVDEGDVGEGAAAAAEEGISRLIKEIGDHIAGFRRSEVIRDGFRVAIIGAPNAGKSSLLNALAGREAAIVTDEPGTTRDVLEVVLDLNGVKCVVADTAGIREPAGRVETIGIGKAREAAQAADLVLLLVDRSAPATVDVTRLPSRVVTVGTKSDLVDGEDAGSFDLAISVKENTGIGELIDAIRRLAAEAAGDAGDALPLKLRHVERLSRCIAALDAARNLQQGLELRAEELRRAGDEIGRITGRIDPEELLGVVFSSFCIGK